MSLTNIKAPVSREMKDFEKFFRSTVRTEIPLLDQIANHILRRKGKQLRPMLVLLSAKLTGEPNKSTFTAAAMIELLHTATLIHDDVVDDSYERRGFFSIYAIWKTKISVLVGDYLLSRGLLLAVENKEYRVLEIISQAVKEMSEGELYQIKKSRKLDITESEYFEIIRKKTATLMIACTAAGASSVNAPDEQVEMLRQYSAHAGIAFQIKDDLFDYQKKGITGKPAANDIKEKKLTLPLIHALSIASRKEKREIITLIRNNRNNSQKIDKIIDFVVKKNGIEYATAVMEEHKVKALECLNHFPDNEAKKSLTDLAFYITERKK